MWRERKLYNENVCGMENCSVGYDSVLRCSVWEYRDQIFLISACIQNHIIHEYLDCDFVGVRNGYFSVWDGSGVIGEKHAYFVLNVRCSG